MNRKMFAPGEVKLDDQGYIEAAFAQLDVIDKDGDVTLPGAFPAKEVPLSAYGHTSWEGALPLGKGVIEERGDWAVFKGQFFLDTTHGRDAFSTVKGLGDLAEYSYGYDVLEDERGTRDGKAVRLLKGLDVFEVSPVLRGAGVGTHTLAIKSDAPGTDAPFADHLSWYLDEGAALIERTKDRLAFRQSEGRDLSAKDYEGLQEMASRLWVQLDAISDLLPEPEPAKADTTLLVEIERARALGVKT